MDSWETLFSVLISIGGMALFLVYFNARIQEYQERSNRLRLEDRMNLRIRDIELWFDTTGLPRNMVSSVGNTVLLQTVIMQNIHRLEENQALDVQNVLSILPINEKKNIMRFLFLPSLRALPELQNLDDGDLGLICEYIVQVTYSDNTSIVKQGDPLGRLLYIAQGIAVTSVAGGQGYQFLQQGNLYGAQLLNWAFNAPAFPVLPLSDMNVTASGKVDAFAIRAHDLMTVFRQHNWGVHRRVENVPE